MKLKHLKLYIIALTPLLIVTIFLISKAQSSGLRIRVEGSRIYCSGWVFGNNELNWIDVGKVGQMDETYEKFIVQWEDNSDIEKVTQFDSLKYLDIEKANSKWRFYYWSEGSMRLVLLSPIIEDEGKIIYKRRSD